MDGLNGDIPVALVEVTDFAIEFATACELLLAHIPGHYHLIYAFPEIEDSFDPHADGENARRFIEWGGKIADLFDEFEGAAEETQACLNIGAADLGGVVTFGRLTESSAHGMAFALAEEALRWFSENKFSEIAAEVYLSPQHKKSLQRYIIPGDYAALIARIQQEQSLAWRAWRMLQLSHAAGKGAKVRRTKKSWTQDEVDAAVSRYRANRASQFRDLVAGIDSGVLAMKRAARKAFGRNVMAKEIGCPKAMVSKAPDWLVIRDSLHLERRRFGGTIDFQIAIDRRGTEQGDLTATDVERREAIRLINARVKRKEDREALLEQLQEGRCSSSEAVAIATIGANGE